MTQKNIVIIGESFGGLSAAIAARQNNENAQITIIENQAKSSPDFLKRFNINLISDLKPWFIDIDSKILLVKSNFNEVRINYNSLIFAVKPTSKKIYIDNLNHPERISYFHWLYSKKNILKKARILGAKKVLILGAGLSGIQAAILLKNAGISVLLIDNKKHIHEQFSLAFSIKMQAELYKHEIKILLGCEIRNINAKAGHIALEFSNNQEFIADMIIICAGIKPNNKLLKQVGASLDPNGLTIIDDYMQTTLPHIYACGVGVSVPTAIGKRKWLLQPFILERIAQIAGHNAAISESKNFEAIKPFCGTSFYKIGRSFFGFTGSLEAEAKKILGHENILFSTAIFKNFFVRIIINKLTHKIIGAEVAGRTGIRRRLDMLSMAILNNLSIEEFFNSDISFISRDKFILEPLKEAAFRALLYLKNKTQIITADTLALWVMKKRNFMLIDVSEASELSYMDNQKILHLPLAKLRDSLDELIKSQYPLIFCSNKGRSSYFAQQIFTQRGFKDAFYLDGGLSTWNFITESYKN